ncbi:hypothetical protein LOAG_01199 [Loa loa]|uniref:Uncharacterized protein n=1 Tax=Loa loa TaxID=7209 RepID=A0A1S0U9E3_LOALO|nr:hypothetical protein LOAG_01199 [Loa loa]EFO27281.1 hypothetical protein LOAG_01199 [Loa loa]
MYTPKQFGVLTRRKFADDRVDICALKNCQQNDLITQKNRELLKIRQENSVKSKLSNELPLRGMKSGNNKQLPFQLSSLVRSAADMLNLFQRIATEERNTQYIKRITRRQPMQQLQQLPALREFQSGKRLLSTKSLAASNFRDIPIPSVVLKDNHQSKTTADDTVWSELLFGPRGVLTAVFHILDDRRKITTKKRDRTAISKNGNSNSQTIDAYHQSDLSLLPDFLIDDVILQDLSKRTKQNQNQSILQKFFEAFLTGSKGNFDERISNLPEILGICNRLSCGDIYKAIDEFRKSEFFINFQTALQLIQDPKGWEILGDLISNPDLIAQFINGAGAKGDRGRIGNLFGGITRAGKSSRNNSKEIGPEDGDIGIDFSKMVENGNSGYGGEFRKPKKPTAEELPEIAENIDAVDYYNAVETGTDIDGTETIAKPDVIVVTEATTIAPLMQTKVPPMIPDLDLILPEISENIDQIGQTKIIIDASTPTPAKISNRRNVATLRRLRRPYITVTYKPVVTRTTAIRKQAIISSIPITTRHPAWTGTTSTRLIPTTTTRNFREDSDYYAMYYDDVRG